MTTCPNCGTDLSSPGLFKRSPRDLVEGLELDARLLADARRIAPRLNHSEELEAFKDMVRAVGYKTNAGPIRDARAAFRTYLRRAVTYAPKGPRTNTPASKQAVRQADRKEE